MFRRVQFTGEARAESVFGIGRSESSRRGEQENGHDGEHSGQDYGGG